MARARTHKSGPQLELVLGLLLAGGMTAAVLLSPLLFPDGGEKINLMARLTLPFQTWAHPLGTDPLGRDVLARVITGGKISLLVGFTSVVGAVVIGVVMGLVAQYLGFDVNFALYGAPTRRATASS